MSTCSGFLLESGKERNDLFLPFFCNFCYASVVKKVQYTLLSIHFKSLSYITLYMYVLQNYRLLLLRLPTKVKSYIIQFCICKFSSRQQTERHLGEFVHCVMVMLGPIFYLKRTPISVRLRFFDQVGHQTSKCICWK